MHKTSFKMIELIRSIVYCILLSLLKEINVTFPKRSFRRNISNIIVLNYNYLTDNLFPKIKNFGNLVYTYNVYEVTLN